jgi:nucleotidyltransferase/DNA polymerase involved in DNA repair
LLRTVPLNRIPEYKRKLSAEIRRIIEDQFQIHNVEECLLKEDHLLASINPESVSWLLEKCKGIDLSEVKVSGPPKSLSVSMTLTPIKHSQMEAIRRIIAFLVQDLRKRLQRDEIGMFCSFRFERFSF